VAKLEQPSRDVMRACAGLHADQAPRNIGQSLHELRTGHPRAHDDLAAPILANQMKGDFTDIDPNCSDIGSRLCMGWHRWLLQARCSPARQRRR
jgi:hypothetical protein